jgi:hypothetical protein
MAPARPASGAGDRGVDGTGTDMDGGPVMHRWNRCAAGAAATALLAVLLAACGGDDDTGGTGGGSQSPVTIDVTEKSGSITPDDGHVVDVAKGQQIQIVMTSDVADEIHVHSIPEHEFEVKAGAESEKLPRFSVDTPGRFVVESHGLDVTLVTLQVS